jgi:enoyl-CoA hydratase/carnithine racemase
VIAKIPPEWQMPLKPVIWWRWNYEEGTVLNKALLNLEITGKIAILTLGQPDSGNAFHLDFADKLSAVLNSVVREASVLIVRAEGEIFSAGAHFDVLKHNDTPQKSYSYIKGLNRAIRQLIELPLATVAAVNGAAVGGGASLALACDFIIVSEKARFILPFVDLGLIPDTGGLWLLSRRTGIARAKEVALAGAKISGQDAVACGIASAFYPSAQIDAAVRAKAADLAAKAPLAVEAVKRISNSLVGLDLDSYFQTEEALIGLLGNCAEHQNAVKALLNKGDK